MKKLVLGLYLLFEYVEVWLWIWIELEVLVEVLFFNNMEVLVFEKYVVLLVLFVWLCDEFGVVVRMSGSGSVCYVLVVENVLVVVVMVCICEVWGDDVFVVEV